MTSTFFNLDLEITTLAHYICWLGLIFISGFSFSILFIYYRVISESEEVSHMDEVFEAVIPRGDDRLHFEVDH